MNMTTKSVVAAILALTQGVALAASPAQAGRHETSFESAPGYAAADVVSQRMMPPIAFDAVRRAAKESGQNLHALTVRPRDEKWLVFAPENNDKEQKYGVVVGFSQTPDPHLSDHWKNIFKREHLIFVAAKKAGENSRIMERRIPLALIGLNGVVKRYPVDPQRIYAYGAGEAAQIAAATAVGFGDIFKGAIFVNPQIQLGSKQLPLPAEPIFERLAANARYVFISGRNAFDRHQTKKSADSFRANCLRNLTTIVLPAQGNVPAMQSVADDSIAFLQGETSDKGADPDQCVGNLEDAASAAANDARTLLDQGKPEAARNALMDMQSRYGGLSGAMALKLNNELEGGAAGH